MVETMTRPVEHQKAVSEQKVRKLIASNEKFAELDSKLPKDSRELVVSKAVALTKASDKDVHDRASKLFLNEEVAAKGNASLNGKRNFFAREDIEALGGKGDFYEKCMSLAQEITGADTTRAAMESTIYMAMVKGELALREVRVELAEKEGDRAKYKEGPVQEDVRAHLENRPEFKAATELVKEVVVELNK